MTEIETVTSFDETKIAYKFFGKPDANAVRQGNIIVAAACGGAVLDKFGELVGKSTPVAMMDMRGTGESGVPTSRFQYSVPAYSHDIMAVLDKVKAKRGMVLGYSHGAEAAVYTALSEPERVRALVLIEPGLLNDREVLTERLRLAESGNIEDALRVTFTYANPEITPKELEEGVRTAVDYYRNNPETLIGEFRARALYNVTPDLLNEIRVPTLVIGGTKSNIRQNIATVAQSIPNASMFWIPGANHFLGDQAIKSVAEIARTFVSIQE